MSSLPPPPRPDPKDHLDCSELLATCDPFSNLPLAVRDILSGFMYRRQFAAGEALIRQGEPGDSLILVALGHADVIVGLGNEKKVLKTVTRGDVVGEMALITREPRHADIIARDDLQAFVLPAEIFETLTNRHPSICVVLTELLSKRLGQERIDALGHKVLSGYRILGTLGRGGMAIVYEAIRESDGRPVALKMMRHPLVYDPNALSRFQREADIAESLSHDNIVKMYARFEAHRTHFLVMELCDGPTLGRVIRMNGALQGSAVKKILGQMAQGLIHLHEQGLVHRDLKPSNVLMTRRGVVKLADFGLARQNFNTRLTQHGIVLGTPAYMAPEQIAGRECDERTDLYAFGCVAYEMLTGKLLFDQTDLTDLIYSKCSWSLPSREQFGNHLDPELYDVLRLSLVKAPEGRTLHLREIADWAGALEPEMEAWRTVPDEIPSEGGTISLGNGQGA